MSDQTDQSAMLAALQAQLAALQRQAPAAASPWQQPPAAPTAIVGVSVPIKVQTPAGSVRCYLALPPEAAATPAALMAALESLAAAGVPIDAWQPSGDKGGSWGNRSSQGGWNRGGSDRGWRS